MKSIHEYSLFAQIFLCPFTSLFILILVYIYSRIYILGFSIRSYSYSLQDIYDYCHANIFQNVATTSLSFALNQEGNNHIEERRRSSVRNPSFRIFSSQFLHNKFLHLLFNVITLWEIRKIEFYYGSFFFFKYSLLLILSEFFLSFLITSFLIHFLAPRMNINLDF